MKVCPECGRPVPPIKRAVEIPDVREVHTKQVWLRNFGWVDFSVKYLEEAP